MDNDNFFTNLFKKGLAFYKLIFYNSVTETNVRY